MRPELKKKVWPAFALLLAAACRSGTEEPVPGGATAALAEPAAASQEHPVTATRATVPSAPVADGIIRAELGQLAPDFALKDFDGREYKLSNHRGKIVVLEWFNPGCPFVQYAYSDGPMREMRERYVGQGIVWLAINSSAAGMEGADILQNKEFLAQHRIKTPVLVDASGVVGRSYGAKTTPQMYVINERGVLVYRGALDNAPAGKLEGSTAKVNYVDAAINDLKSGHGVTTSDTKSYGCNVKYGR